MKLSEDDQILVEKSCLAILWFDKNFKKCLFGR